MIFARITLSLCVVILMTPLRDVYVSGMPMIPYSDFERESAMFEPEILSFEPTRCQMKRKDNDDQNYYIRDSERPPNKNGSYIYPNYIEIVALSKELKDPEERSGGSPESNANMERMPYKPPSDFNNMPYKPPSNSNDMPYKPPSNSSRHPKRQPNDPNYYHYNPNNFNTEEVASLLKSGANTIAEGQTEKRGRNPSNWIDAFRGFAMYGYLLDKNIRDKMKAVGKRNSKPFQDYVRDYDYLQ